MDKSLFEKKENEIYSHSLVFSCINWDLKNNSSWTMNKHSEGIVYKKQFLKQEMGVQAIYFLFPSPPSPLD